MVQKGLYTSEATYPRYTRQQEAKLAKAASTGSAAREQLILSQIPWLLKMAAQWYEADMELREEFEAEAGHQLIRAVDRFDPERGRLTTYAWWYLRRAKSTVDRRRAIDAKHIDPAQQIDLIEAAPESPDKPESDLLGWAIRAIDNRWGKRNAEMCRQRINGCTLVKIAQEYGISKQRVRQIWEAAIVYLRQILPKDA